MELLADGLLIATAMTAGLYCLVLSRRLQRLTESGNGIGPQIEALDRALGDTRAALSETRETVSELRGSAKTAAAQLAREIARGEDLAELIGRGVDEAKATMQRLYEAGDRIEAHENRPRRQNRDGEDPPGDHGDADAGEGAPRIEAEPADSDHPAVDFTDENVDSADDSGAPDSPTGPKVILPEGENVQPEAAESPGAAGLSTAPVLKAERVVL